MDNLHLSEPRNGPPDDPDSRSNEGGPAPAEDQSPPVSLPFRAGDCTLGAPDPVPGQVAALVEASIADSTRRAYRTDLAHFAAWGGQLPAEPAQVASYLAAHAETLSVATLVRRIATISKAHEARGLPNPCRSEIVRATMRGVKRTRGVAQREAKPLLREDLFRVLDAMGEGVKDARDRALLLIGFAGGFRRSEIVGLNCDDVERVRQGLIVTLRRSKTDQEGAGRKIGIPFGRTRHCPVLALDHWLAVSGIEAGPVFRPVDRHGRVASERLSGEAVSLDRQGAGRRRRHRPGRLLRPQPARRLRHQRRAGGRVDAQDQVADWPRQRRHARPLRPRRRALSRKRCGRNAMM